jgi:hypothetical protein
LVLLPAHSYFPQHSDYFPLFSFSFFFLSLNLRPCLFIPIISSLTSMRRPSHCYSPLSWRGTTPSIPHKSWPCWWSPCPRQYPQPDKPVPHVTWLWIQGVKQHVGSCWVSSLRNNKWRPELRNSCHLLSIDLGTEDRS